MEVGASYADARRRRVGANWRPWGSWALVAVSRTGMDQHDRHNHAELQLYPVDGNDPALANNYRFGSRVLRNFRATSPHFSRRV